MTLARKQLIQNLHTTNKYTFEQAKEAIGELYAGEIAVQNNDDEAALFISGETSGIAKFLSEKTLMGKNFGTTALTLTNFSDVEERIDEAVKDVIDELNKMDADITASTENGHVTMSLKERNGIVTEISIEDSINGGNVYLSGYEKAETSSAINETDSVNTAIGKLEKSLEDVGGDAITLIESGNGINAGDKVNHKQTISVNADTTADNGVNLGFNDKKLVVTVDAIEEWVEEASESTNLMTGKAAKGLIGTLNYEDSDTMGMYVSSVSESNGKISVERLDIPVLGISNDDKILSLSNENRLLSTSLSISYDNSTRKIQLKGVDNSLVSEFDASDFIKDGMLKDTVAFSATAETQTIEFKNGQTYEFTNLTVGNQYLTFQFTDGAKPTETFSYEMLDMTSTIKVYTGTTGVQIEGYTISAVVDESTEKDSNEIPFLTVGSNGIKVNGIKDEIMYHINLLDSVESGETTDGFISVEIKEENGKLSAVSVTDKVVALAEATAENMGLAEAYDAKNYVDDLVANVLTGLEVTGNVSDTVAGITVEVNETDGLVQKPVVTVVSVDEASGFTDDNVQVASAKGVKSYVDSVVGDLDVTVSDDEFFTEGTTGNVLSIVEENGKLTSVSFNLYSIDGGEF